MLTFSFANSYSFVLYKKYIATFEIPSLLIMDQISVAVYVTFSTSLTVHYVYGLVLLLPK